MRQSMCFIVASFWLLAGIVATGVAENSSDTLVVHEWGTFTELHDAAGTSIGGINTDDEPVPDFVHRLSSHVVQPTNEPWRSLRWLVSKGLYWNSQATMRLETPVIYFYPPAGREEPMKIDVDVQLRGGWLSEFYPVATANAPGLARNVLNRHAVGTLQWHDLLVDAEGEIPATDEHVWLSPRKPAAATVVTPEGEAEEYLFYRGVGSFSGPLRVETDLPENRLRLKSQFHTLGLEEEITIPAAWLVSIQADGNLAYRSLGAISASPATAEVVRETDREFRPADFSIENLDRLRDEMHGALVEDGLFADEATAMLATWERAYFRTPGLRLFYVLPQAWTDDRMPLTLSVPAQIERVMMGRIELITDRQRELLAEMSKQAPTSREWISELPKSDPLDRFLAGDNEAVRELGAEIPRDYAAYLELGRFRNALLHGEIRRTKNGNLFGFAATHGLLTREMQADMAMAFWDGLAQ